MLSRSQFKAHKKCCSAAPVGGSDIFTRASSRSGSCATPSPSIILPHHLTWRANNLHFLAFNFNLRCRKMEKNRSRLSKNAPGV
ncbi:hypothetical protein PHMEG_00011922 [Phytophthora megakarya]|uniref:Uncharacterized protein n=1 Tax=Phytophthora megakarya TaxID=4795 RepID=A0A225WA16_9STRA|nr:hypothetical protein PHMEG_00011922 [Phytophthora megakarya]